MVFSFAQLSYGRGAAQNSSVNRPSFVRVDRGRLCVHPDASCSIRTHRSRRHAVAIRRRSAISSPAQPNASYWSLLLTGWRASPSTTPTISFKRAWFAPGAVSQGSRGARVCAPGCTASHGAARASMFLRPSPRASSRSISGRRKTRAIRFHHPRTMRGSRRVRLPSTPTTPHLPKRATRPAKAWGLAFRSSAALAAQAARAILLARDVLGWSAKKSVPSHLGLSAASVNSALARAIEKTIDARASKWRPKLPNEPAARTRFSPATWTRRTHV